MNEEEKNVAHILQIDDTWLPGVRDYDFTLEDIDTEDSNRSEGGYAHRDILRPNVYHASVTHIVPYDDMLTICDAIKAEKTIEISVLAPGKSSESPYADITAYVSKIDVHLEWLDDIDAESGYKAYFVISYQLVEV